MTTHTDQLVLAAAGAAGAALWAAQQPLDQRLLGTGYDDVELLGRAVTRGDRWRLPGVLLHVTNGAVFGLVFAQVRRASPQLPPRLTAHAMTQAENFGLYPLAAIVDRVHPRRDVLAPAFGRRQLLQATWRHALLGFILGEVAARLESRAPAPAPPARATPPRC
jgi:hypothetical protein